MEKKVEIIVFSHVSGKVESVNCDRYDLEGFGNIAYIRAINDECVTNIIPWNRVKQINCKR